MAEHQMGNNPHTPKENVDEIEMEIKKNLELIKLGKPLTTPLSILKQQCNFQKRWEDFDGEWAS